MNPVLLGVTLLCILCLCKINVLLSMLLSLLVSGLVGGLPLVSYTSASGERVVGIFTYLTDGFSSNGETALAYILLGTLATALAHVGLAEMLGQKVTETLGSKPKVLVLTLGLIACFSQNLVPIHIAFIPILVPPLLSLMSQRKMDRRAVACALAFGLKAPYIALPLGFGLSYQRIVATNLTQNGMEVTVDQVASVNWILALCMFAGLLTAVFVTYKEPREYQVREVEPVHQGKLSFEKKHAVSLFALLTMVVLQVIYESLAFAALGGLVLLLLGGAVALDDLDHQMMEGIRLMGFIAFVMLVAGGFAEVMEATGGVEDLVESAAHLVGGSKVMAAVMMTAIGLLITMGIGSSFSTIPILAVIFVPLCQRLGFSESGTILLVSAAAALGDAGSPASDTTLGPTSGLNADGQHQHISDTCIPTFLHFNLPLMVGAVVFSLML